MSIKKIFSNCWYFIFAILTAIITPIVDEIIIAYVGEERLNYFLNSNISIKIFLPTVLTLIVLIVCLIIYIVKAKKTKKYISQDEKERLENAMCNAVENFSDIESIQAYEYSIKDDEKDKYIITKFISGIADERIEINSILQSYFYFPYSLFKKIYKFSKAYKLSITSNDRDIQHEKELEYKSIGKDLSTLLLKRLNEIKTPDNINKYDCELYRVLSVILSVIQEEPIESVLLNADVENALIIQKRSGILGTIFLNDLYIFKNQKSLTKKRIYFSFPIFLNKSHKNTILVAAINDRQDSSDDTDLKYLCGDVKNFIYNMMKNKEGNND